MRYNKIVDRLVKLLPGDVDPMPKSGITATIVVEDLLWFGSPKQSPGEYRVATLADRITVDAKQCGGRPCIRGMRIRVSDVLDLLANGLSPEQVVEELPDLEPLDIQACLRFASRRVDLPVPMA